jgi:hypothetical protein
MALQDARGVVQLGGLARPLLRTESFLSAFRHFDLASIAHYVDGLTPADNPSRHL